MLASAIMWLAPGLAQAEMADELSRAGEGAHESAHAHFANAFVLKIAHVEARRLGRASREAGEVLEAEAEAAEQEEEEPAFERHSALGVSFEHVVVEGWLNLEIGTLLSSAPGGQLVFPSTLLFKLPAELSEAVEGYLGAGAAVEFEREKQWAPIWGFAAAAGLNLWVAPETGFNLDVERSLLFAEELVLELALGLGVVTRF
jgi:hypothetical protein